MVTSNENKDKDLGYLKQCLVLAQESLDAGDEPFGSVLVNKQGDVIATSRNRTNEVNILFHPEIELARWASENLTSQESQQSTMYTTGEHCPMCAAAHGWAGIGTLVYLASGKQLNKWYDEFGRPLAPIHFLPVQDILKEVEIRGPFSGTLLDQIKEMHRLSYLKIKDS
ncbi:nucleoside deaminase [Nonlabens antarcticus]|uniref:nucleoside deaminase n=1 Tax=Nonlabens antarcticus TaxID=392714 RepID=UPI0018915769|nr:nucleoside deaminase [Nonlabens antarcticus]